MGEEIRTLISVAALLGSALSLYLTRRLWLQSNRPIVVAFVDECSSGGMATTFNLILSNVGNRPALNVRLHADVRAIETILGEGVVDTINQAIKRCFDPDSAVPVLRNGEELRNAFGSYGAEMKSRQVNYGREIPISVSYQDLAGRRYKEKMSLKVFARNGFAGAIWKAARGSRGSEARGHEARGSGSGLAS